MAATSMKADGNVTRVAGPGDRDPAVLDRLAQVLEDLALELGQLVEEEEPVVGQADLARLGHEAAADETGVRDRVMGRAEGPGADRPLPGQQPGRAVDPGHLEHLVVGQVGEDRGQAAGQHGLPRPGRPDEEDVVAPGRGHLEGPLDVLLALDVLEVHRIDGRGDELPLVEAAGRDLAGLAQEADDADEVLEGEDVEAADEGRLAGVGEWERRCRGSPSPGPSWRWAGGRGRA